ncbi:hypothetical protein KSP39_PZI023602 [Platanthera zijinensis]|uniref:Uncharacterized protein n=1 Tax=Platanthera zijinensis TaxID=2320716 RepID=A0AAP0ASU1_9ASPA
MTAKKKAESSMIHPRSMKNVHSANLIICPSLKLHQSTELESYIMVWDSITSSQDTVIIPHIKWAHVGSGLGAWLCWALGLDEYKNGQSNGRVAIAGMISMRTVSRNGCLKRMHARFANLLLWETRVPKSPSFPPPRLRRNHLRFLLIEKSIFDLCKGIIICRSFPFAFPPLMYARRAGACAHRSARGCLKAVFWIPPFEESLEIF